MRTWLKITLAGFALVATLFLALAAVSGYFVLRNLDTRTAGESEAVRDMDVVRARFGPRPPLVEIVDPRRADIRINRPQEPAAARVDTIHVVSWKSEDGQVVRMDAPLWLMRFSSVNLLSRMGLGPARLRLTVQDIERYGPGILADYRAPGEFRVLVWVD